MEKDNGQNELYTKLAKAEYGCGFYQNKSKSILTKDCGRCGGGGGGGGSHLTIAFMDLYFMEKRSWFHCCCTQN